MIYATDDLRAVACILLVRFSELPTNTENTMSKSASNSSVSSGLGFGAALAITMSWSVNQSILWAILHGICSWLYVIYFALGYGR